MVALDDAVHEDPSGAGDARVPERPHGDLDGCSRGRALLNAA
jgi:hypothetical protein